MIGQGVEPGELLIDPSGERKGIELIALAHERRHGGGPRRRAGADAIQRRLRRIVVPAAARAMEFPGFSGHSFAAVYARLRTARD